MNNNRSAKIASIIEQRRPLKEKIGVVKENINTLASNLRNLAECRDRLMAQVDDRNVAVRLKEINFLTIQQQIAEELAALTKLEARFSRDTLNIGVVGLMGQGKSTLLQSLSGLTDDEIPARKGGACTAVRSIICHQEGQTYAEVTIHSEESFLEEVISPYYKELNLGSTPTSLDAFARPLPPLLSGNATKNSMYDHLQRDYHQNLQQYRHLLNSGLPRKLPPIPKEEIPKYIVQQRNGLGDLISFNHLAVQQVEIFCPFKNSEVGKIALVDVPGLGDTRLGDENLMLETLGEEVDLVIFVRRPDALRYGWEKKDTDLYKSAAEALPDLASRSFMVLNLVTGDDNFVGCKHHKDTIKDKHINVVQCTIANCSKPESANEVLDLVLNYLVDNITDLDKQYASYCQKRLIEIQKVVDAELNKARTAFGQDDLDDYQAIEELFSKLFGNDKKGWWKDVAFSLQKLRSELWLTRQSPDNNLQAGIDTAIAACQKGAGILLSDSPIEEINERISVSSPFRAYADYQDELRVLLSRNFQSLDEGLKQSIENVKSQVSEVLTQQGRLGMLTNESGSNFFKSISDLVPERLGKLKQGFKIIADFELSYRGLILHRIRQHLDGLTNITATSGQSRQVDDQQNPTLLVSSSTSAEEILEALKIDYDIAVNRIKPALEEFLCEPSQAAYAMVEEFVDNVIRQEDISEEWKNFLRPLRGQIWPDEFGKPEQERQQRKAWLDLINHVANTSKSDLFQFSN
ncbi:dynamin family protein [Aerosakkonemataceae cyanobacterium BLCC-F154]|uniref:Dynamin family protein n=1 Tax=Floridaenema fluviatile BLCC-F154 TaxID=3153640 RepID=A0ABV4Y908_9CYAN